MRAWGLRACVGGCGCVCQPPWLSATLTHSWAMHRPCLDRRQGDRSWPAWPRARAHACKRTQSLHIPPSHAHIGTAAGAHRDKSINAVCGCACSRPCKPRGPNTRMHTHACALACAALPGFGPLIMPQLQITTHAPRTCEKAALRKSLYASSNRVTSCCVSPAACCAALDTRLAPLLLLPLLLLLLETGLRQGAWVGALAGGPAHPARTLLLLAWRACIVSLAKNWQNGWAQCGTANEPCLRPVCRSRSSRRGASLQPLHLHAGPPVRRPAPFEGRGG